MSKENIVNNILGSIDLIVTERFKGLQFNKTIICSIIDDTKKTNGIYKVSDGSTSFEAYSENNTYKKGDSVRVSIDNGDMSAEKFIIGKYVTGDDITPITYVSPLDQILIVKDNIIDIDPDDVYGMVANGGGYGKNTSIVPLFKVDYSKDEYKKLKVSGLYDTFYLQADFKTLLSDYVLQSGEYGIRADFYIPQKDILYIKSLYLSSKEMFGDPYNFSIYTTQTQTFDLENVQDIESINFYLYQCNDFTEGDTKGIEVADYANILMKNVKAGFGVHSSDFEDNTLKIYTDGDLSYKKANTQSSYTNKRDISLTWYNKDKNGKYIGFDDAVKDNSGKPIWYNELDYINASKKQQSLVDGMADEKVIQNEAGLTINANIKEAKVLLEKLYELLNNDLCNLIEELDDNVKNTLIQEDDRDYINEIQVQAKNIQTITTESYDYIKNALAAAAYRVRDRKLISNVEEESPRTPTEPDPDELNYYTKLETAYNSIKSRLTALDNYSKSINDSYRGIYDNYLKKIEQVKTEADALYNNIKGYYYNTENDEPYLEQWAWELYQDTFAEGYIYIKYKPDKDFADYADRYCVYWYRYDPEHIFNLDYDDPYAELGYGKIELAGYNSQSINITLDGEHMVEEKFYAVLFFNHEKFKSNVITFINNTSISNTANNNLNDYITIEHADNSFSSYQKYGESNYLINSAEQYTPRKVKVQFYKKDATLYNDGLKGAQIYWYIPKENTMLYYNMEDQVSELLQLTDTESKYSKQNYSVFYKDNFNNDFYFTYRIKDYYIASATENHIICKIVKGEYEYEEFIYFTFSSFGTSGTDYTLTLTPIKDQSAVKIDSSGKITPLQIAVNLYDYNNQSIDIKDSQINVNIIGGTNYSQSLKNKIISVIYNNTGDYYGILEVTINTASFNGQGINLKSFYPLACTTGQCLLEGATTIIYDNNGTNPAFYKEIYKIYDSEKKEEISINSCSINTPTSNQGIINYYYPKLINKKIIPCTMYLQPTSTGYFIKPVVTINTSKGNYYQSIYIGQNRYPSAMLNAWDGELTIDKNNGTILSTMVGAGRKTSKNTFEGILMGDIEAGAEFNPDNKSGLGLYGFNDGAQSFGFNIDGTAFIGKSGCGRIEFDGNNGAITSASYEITKDSGMKIDLDDGFIHMRGAQKVNNTYIKNTQSEIYLSVLGNPYFKINSKNGNPLIYIGKNNNQDNYYLQTDNFIDGINSNITIKNGTTGDELLDSINGDSLYIAQAGSGTKIDLANGKITSYDFSINAKNPSGGQILLTSNANETYPLNINDLFKVNWNGIIRAKGGVIGEDNKGQLNINAYMLVGGGKLDTSIDEQISITEQEWFSSKDIYIIRGLTDNDTENIQFGIPNNNFYFGPGGLVFKNASKIDTDNISGSKLDSHGLVVEGRDYVENSMGLTSYLGNGIYFNTLKQPDKSVLFNLNNSNALLKSTGSIFYTNDTLNINAYNITIAARNKLIIKGQSTPSNIDETETIIGSSQISTNKIIVKDLQVNDEANIDNVIIKDSCITVPSLLTTNTLTVSSYSSVESLPLLSSSKYNTVGKVRKGLETLETTYNTFINGDYATFKADYNNFKNDTFSQYKNQIQDKLNELSSKIDAVIAENTSLKATNADLQKKNTNLQNTVNSQKATISELNGDIEDLNDTISDQSDIISEQDDTISELNGDIEDLNDTISDLEDRIEELEKELENCSCDDDNDEGVSCDSMCELEGFQNCNAACGQN